MRKVLLIGSTGSIGTSTLEVINRHPEYLKLVAICARTYSDTLIDQIRNQKPEYIIITDPEARTRLQAEGIDVRDSGLLFELCRSERIDTLVFAKSGISLVELIFEALKYKKRVCLATKEVIVSFGELLNLFLARYDGEIIPIDSEHVALHQCLDRRRTADVRRLILTASGGPFHDRDELSSVTVDETLKHPVWPMGQKITVDSATLMNKGFEMIEAHYLFKIPAERIEVVIHPQCIVHSLVEFNDFSILAQLSHPDMRLPIQYALLYPERLPSLVEPLDLVKVETLNFYPPRLDAFPCIGLARDALNQRGTTPAVLVGADEEAVDLFLKRKISFNQIPELIRRALDHHKNISNPGLEEIKQAGIWAKEYVRSECSRLS